MGAGDLSAALWQERRQLELLLFRLETQRLHVRAGNVQWLSFTASEVEGVLDRLRFEALARSVESAAVAAEWGLPAQATLPELIAGAPAASWPEVLREHLVGLKDLLRQLGDAARAADETLRKLTPPGSSGASREGASGTAPGTDTAEILEHLTTAANIERALAITRRTRQPLLAQYLGGDGE
ncbi:flagellar protein FlgN [Arthrobacter sp. UYCu712]|uniref:flagellar protein FlgN n=1 Tax=Arthrobacter sp. UYCu712 TaxID=3156340 RepID=UPI00339707EB